MAAWVSTDGGTATEISSHIHCPRGGEIEVLAANGKAVHEADAAAGGMSAIAAEGSGFQQRGSHQADFGDLAAHAVDLNPVADANAALAHEDKPAEKRENEILQCDGEGGGGEAEDGGRFVRRAEDTAAG